MLLGLFLSALFFFAKSAGKSDLARFTPQTEPRSIDAAQSTVVCVAGQCIQGYTNLTSCVPIFSLSQPQLITSLPQLVLNYRPPVP